MGQSPLLKLPNELLDNVAELISRQSSDRGNAKYPDLRLRQFISLALTCRRLRDIVEKRMYHHISVRGRPSRNQYDLTLPQLYRTLRERNDFAQQVRSLDLFVSLVNYSYTEKDGKLGLPRILEVRTAGKVLEHLSALQHLSITFLDDSSHSFYPWSFFQEILGTELGGRFSVTGSLQPYLQNVQTLELQSGILHPLYLTLPKLEHLCIGIQLIFARQQILPAVRT